MTQTSKQWTPPFHGVQHLSGLKREFQITVTDRNVYGGAFAECDVFLPGQYGPKSAVTSTVHDSIEQARAHGEQQAKMLGALQ